MEQLTENIAANLYLDCWFVHFVPLRHRRSVNLKVGIYGSFAETAVT